MAALNPTAIPDGFRWRTQYGHLTYAGFIPHERLVNLARSVTSTPLLGFSVVHEVGEDDYQHTHFAWVFSRRLDLVGARKFDIFHAGAWVHPHMQPKLTARSMEMLFNEYHLGRKYDVATGRKKHTPPADGPWQKLPPEFEWARAIMNEICAAPSLKEAVIAAGVRPRSVLDVNMIRRAEPLPAKRFKHLYPASSFNMSLIPANWRVLHVWGGTGLGKTKMACALFKNPLYIKPFNAVGQIEKLKQFDASVHDGIVFDEANLSSMSREQGIALTDFEDESTIHVRYESIDLPAGVKKVFVSNTSAIWPASDAAIGAIARRVTAFHASEQLFV